MNILSAEEMKQTEHQLLKIIVRKEFGLRLPDQRDYQAIEHFETVLFPAAGTTALAQVQQIIKLTDNVKSRPLADPKSLYHMLLYGLLSLLYNDKPKSDRADTADYLLETIKCSLFSPDVDFTLVKGVDCPLDCLQMKAMAARFLVLMEEQRNHLINRLKCALWVLDHNPILLTTFTLFFRFILIRLQIEGSEHYDTCGNVSQSIVNLIEYFDLNYRDIGDLFLFYEEGVFLGLIEGQLAAGDYFENESEKNNQREQLQIKSSVRMNMVESFVVNVEEKSAPLSSKNRNAIIESDIKLINFILEREDTKDNKEKGYELDTPHFNHDSQDLFHFRKHTKESFTHQPKIVSREFILDHDESLIDSDNGSNGVLTPFLGGEKDHTLAPRLPPPKQSNICEGAPDQLEKVAPDSFATSNRGKMLFGSKKNPELIASFNSIFNPQQGESVSSTAPTIYFPDAEDVNEGSPTLTLSQILNCPCRCSRRKRNSLASGVVSVACSFPVKSKSEGRIQTEAMFQSASGNNPAKTEWTGSSIPVPRTLGYHTPRADYKPAFLQTVKKNQDNSYAINTSRNYITSGAVLLRPQRQLSANITAASKSQKVSGIMTGEMPVNQDPDAKSLTRMPQSKSCKLLPSYKKPEQTPVVQPWRPVPKRNEVPKEPGDSSFSNRSTHSCQQNPNTGVKGNAPFKFYTPAVAAVGVGSGALVSTPNGAMTPMRSMDFSSRSRKPERSLLGLSGQPRE